MLLGFIIGFSSAIFFIFLLGVFIRKYHIKLIDKELEKEIKNRIKITEDKVGSKKKNVNLFVMPEKELVGLSYQDWGIISVYLREVCGFTETFNHPKTDAVN